MGACAIVSFRLGLSDGVSVVAAAWEQSLRDLGWDTWRVAGEGPVDRVVPGLAIDAPEPADPAALEAAVADALAGADLVLVENLLTIPMNLPASRAVARVLAGRPAVLHHHDPPWQRDRFAHVTELPATDPAWCHVTINRLTARQFRRRGLEATTIHNGFPPPAAGDRDRSRDALGIAPGEVLAAHPVRAIERKNVPAALELSAALGATYWLPGPAEDGYGPELERILAAAEIPVRRRPVEPGGPAPATMADLYAACDVVLFPSTWEGFGNPPIEAALHRRPVVVGDYPVADELRDLGFGWYRTDDGPRLARALADPERSGSGPDGFDTLAEAIDANARLAAEEFSLERMTGRIERLLAGCVGGRMAG